RSPICAARLLRYLAVQHDDGHTATTRGEQEVRPELRFDDDDEPRIEVREETPHGEREIEREQDHAMLRIRLTCGFEPRHRVRRDHERRAGTVPLETRDERLEQRDLAGRRAVQPDRAADGRTELEPEAGRCVPEAAVPDEAIRKPWRGQHESEQIAEVEQKAHRTVQAAATVLKSAPF